MDGDNNGALDFSEMLQALQELGVLDGIKVNDFYVISMALITVAVAEGSLLEAGMYCPNGARLDSDNPSAGNRCHKGTSKGAQGG